MEGNLKAVLAICWLHHYDISILSLLCLETEIKQQLRLQVLPNAKSYTANVCDAYNIPFSCASGTLRAPGTRQVYAVEDSNWYKGQRLPCYAGV